MLILSSEILCRMQGYKLCVISMVKYVVKCKVVVQVMLSYVAKDNEGNVGFFVNTLLILNTQESRLLNKF